MGVTYQPLGHSSWYSFVSNDQCTDWALRLQDATVLTSLRKSLIPFETEPFNAAEIYFCSKMQGFGHNSMELLEV
uniref:Uncharacterized protein n=1 Tax=Romanomermis culicivorax TaxID=13658 RepID=A0A915HPG7_ROMCU